jgi:hypothetical protein
MKNYFAVEKQGKKTGQKLVDFRSNFCPMQTCFPLATNILWFRSL